jgi:hypothetical protein
MAYKVYLHSSYLIYLCTYDLYGPVRHAFDAGSIHTRASGRGLGPGNRDFFGPCEMASSLYASALWGPKKSRTRTPCLFPSMTGAR